MDIARAMYLGGELKYAHECDYLSYDKQGLRCAVCGEPVHLKRGSIRKPHFAHYSGTDPQQVEQCELRASSYGNISQINSFIQDRGQRLKIFQSHFLSLISFNNDTLIANSEFNNWINSIKPEHNQAIDNIINNCTDCFIKVCFKIAAKYINSITNNNNESTFIKQEIALEAISYLCVKSSLKLLQYLFYYGIYQLYEHKQNQLFKQDITSKDVDAICHLVIKIIISNSWTEALNYTNLNSSVFKLDGFKHKIQVEMLDNGTVHLNQYLPDGKKLVITVGTLSGTKNKEGNYEIDYHPNFKLTGNKQIHIQLQRLILKAIKTDTRFLSTQHEITTPVEHIGRRKKAAIRKQQAATTTVNQGNVVSLVKAVKSDTETKELPTTVNNEETVTNYRMYLSKMFLSVCADNYDLVGSRLLFEVVSKGTNKHGHASIAYQQKVNYESYDDRKNGRIQHSTDRITTEVNKPLLDFCKLHGIKQNKVLGRIAIQTIRHSLEYLGLLYINKKGYLSYLTFDGNKTNLHPEIKQYLSMHGLRDNLFVAPSRISVNWKQLLGINVIPQSKQGNVSYEYTDNYPYTVI